MTNNAVSVLKYSQGRHTAGEIACNASMPYAYATKRGSRP